MSEIVTRPHRENLVRWAEQRPEVLVLSADLTASCEADGFRDTYPERFFSMGMAEQNMMGFAAGLAREGFFPYVHTFAVFITRRPFDQVAMSIAYPNLPVRLIGFLPGITTPGGVTHQAIDDIGLMRLIPNMTVLECGDATDVESVLDVAQAIDGPVYVRQLRGEVPRLFPADRAHAARPRQSAERRRRSLRAVLRHLHRGGDARHRRPARTRRRHHTPAHLDAEALRRSARDRGHPQPPAMA